MSELSLVAQLEAVLFASGEPLKLSVLSQLTKQPETNVTAALTELASSYADRGIRLIRHEHQYQLVTAPDAAALITELTAEPMSNDLTPAALETLAVIAYQGPLTVRQISEQRGVASDTMVRNLLARGLIEAASTRRAGNQPSYRVSLQFLQQFGLSDASELPAVEANHAN